MAVLGSSLLSSVFTTFYYLVMVWGFARQPALLGVIIALYELTPNVLGIAWAWLRVSLNNVQQIQIGWILRAVGTVLLLNVASLPLQVLGIFLVSITSMIVFSLEKASLTANDTSTHSIINKFVRLNQIQMATGLVSPIAAGYLINQQNNFLLTIIMLIIAVLGLGVSFFIPTLISENIREKKTSQVKRTWRLPENTTMISIVILMFLGNLVLWGPQAIVIPAFFQAFHMSAIDLGTVITCGKVGTLLGLEILRRIHVGINKMAPALALSLALYASGFLVLGIFAPTQILWWGIVTFIINAFEACISPFLNTLISFFYPNAQRRAGTMSFVVSLGNLGEPAGALIVGLATINPAISLGIVGGLGTALGVIFAARLSSQTRNLSEESVQ
jgi:hypothetical protein